jgi:hypothetical protein
VENRSEQDWDLKHIGRLLIWKGFGRALNLRFLSTSFTSFSAKFAYPLCEMLL